MWTLVAEDYHYNQITPLLLLMLTSLAADCQSSSLLLICNQCLLSEHISFVVNEVKSNKLISSIQVLFTGLLTEKHQNKHWKNSDMEIWSVLFWYNTEKKRKFHVYSNKISVINNIIIWEHQSVWTLWESMSLDNKSSGSRLWMEDFMRNVDSRLVS